YCQARSAAKFRPSVAATRSGVSETRLRTRGVDSFRSFISRRRNGLLSRIARADRLVASGPPGKADKEKDWPLKRCWLRIRLHNLRNGNCLQCGSCCNQGTFLIRILVQHLSKGRAGYPTAANGG